MNNNRNSNSNRRRGRNPNRPQGGGGGGGGNQLNRIDSRARGNAPQLLDKYKKLAQDAQHNGDRVQAEYFLQFADHYFRVLNDNKARQDEARAQRGDRGGRDDQNDSQGDNQNDGQNESRGDGRNEGRNNQRSGNPRSNESQDGRDEDDNRRPRRSRYRQDEDDTRDEDSDDDRDEDRDRSSNDRSSNDRGDNDRGSNDRGNGGRSANGRSRGGSSHRDQSEDASDDFDDAPAPKVQAKPVRAPRKRAVKPAENGNGEIDVAVLPPAIGKSSDDAPAKKPALRPRRKRADDTETLV